MVLDAEAERDERGDEKSESEFDHVVLLAGREARSPPPVPSRDAPRRAGRLGAHHEEDEGEKHIGFRAEKLRARTGNREEV